MKQRVNHKWQDQWIINNLFGYSSYKEAAFAYQKEFGVDISVPALKNHCLYKLGIIKPRGPNYRHISKEQAEWFRDTYSKNGVNETRRLWNAKYHDSASLTCIKQIAKRLNVSVESNVAISNRLKAAHGENSKRAIRNVGDTRLECGRLVMKAEDGTWQSAGRCIWEKEHGKIPEGYALIALDGDTTNIAASNLEIIPWNYLGKMQRNNFFSADPNVTMTGIIWCDLDTVLRKEKIHD